MLALGKDILARKRDNPCDDDRLNAAAPKAVMNGKTTADPMIAMESKLITRDNIKDDKGWPSR